MSEGSEIIYWHDIKKKKKLKYKEKTISHNMEITVTLSVTKAVQTLQCKSTTKMFIVNY